MFDLFRNTLPGWQWAILALVPPAIVALYFLKLRRQPLEVPSTYLWKRSIEDLHVNSLWQRLRQSLLMFLQLLLIALAMLALLRPGWEGTKLTGQRFIFLVDHSASMSATDATDAANRLEEAKRSVASLIKQMDTGMTAMIISFADAPQVVQEFTDNRRLLEDRLAAIQPSVRGTDLRGALELADGLANPGRVTVGEGDLEVDIVEPQPATIYIFSDGRFEDVQGFSLGNLEAVYVPIGTFDARNLAITAFATRRNDTRPEERQAFVHVSNLGDEDQSAIVELQLDGRFFDAREITVAAGESGGALFPLGNTPPGALEARLKYELPGGESRDGLAQDDVAYAALNAAEPGRVLVVTPGNVALEVALATERAGRLAKVEFATPDIMESKGFQQEADLGGYELIVFDQCAPARMPRTNTLFIGRLPPEPRWGGAEVAAGAASNAVAGAAAPGAEVEAEADADAGENGATDTVAGAAAGPVVAAPQIIDWDRAHPILANVELGNVAIRDSLVLAPPPGGTVLIESSDGPIAAVAPRDAYQDAVLGFEIFGQDEDGTTNVNTNWPARLSFPTFCLNVLEFLGGGTEDSQIAPVRPGRPVALRTVGNVDELTVVDPTGREHRIRRTAEDVFQFHDTQELGVYQVRRQDQVIERFAVNLFDREESDIRLRPSQDPEAATVTAADLRIGHVDVKAFDGRTPARTEAWKALLLGALFVLVFEWYIYNRRVYL